MYNYIETTNMENVYSMEEEERSDHGGAMSKEIWVTSFTEASAQEFREQVLRRVDKEGTMVIPIYIDSYGGNVDALAKMIETMDEVPNRFVTIVQGKAVSCGSILLSHGDLRFCGPYSRVMVHNVSSFSWGDVYALKSNGDEAMRMNKQFLGLLARNCNMTYEELQKRIKNATDSKEIWMTAQEAVKFGVVDKVGTPALVPILQWACEVVPPKERFSFVDNELVDKESAPKKKRKKNSKV